MCPTESNRFHEALCEQMFTEHDVKVVLAILEGEGNYNQEDIIDFSQRNQKHLRKLGWLRRVKNAINSAGLRIDP